jgi:excisionase family DNA binding protein
MTEMNELLTIDQAAERLSLKPCTVREMCRKKQIQHMKIGPRRGMYRFRPEWISDYLERCTVETEVAGKKAIKRKSTSAKRTESRTARDTNYRKRFRESLKDS